MRHIDCGWARVCKIWLWTVQLRSRIMNRCKNSNISPRSDRVEILHTSDIFDCPCRNNYYRETSDAQQVRRLRNSDIIVKLLPSGKIETVFCVEGKTLFRVP
jgi:hypothetical protein